MPSTAELILLLQGKDEASKVIKDVDGNASGLGKTLGSVGTIAGGFLAAGVVSAGVQKLTGFIGDSIEAAKESKLVNADLAAVLKSTGGVAGVTADHVAGLASKIEKNSLFEGEAVLKGQNLLLTFTNLKNEAGEGNDIFDQASQIMVDMAQRMGTDAAGSAIQLGKALNDPTQGLTALSKAGVSFTDEQKEQIKAMQEAGDMAGAQKMILAELNKEFGGSAKAASDAAGASEKYKDRMNDLKEQIGTKMLPIQLKWQEAQAAAVAFIADKVIPLLESLYAKYYPGVSKAVNDVAELVKKYWPEISAVIEFGVEFVKTRIEGLIQAISGIIDIVTGVVNLVDDLINGRWAQAWEDLKQIAEGIIDVFIGNLKYQFGNIPEIIAGLATNLFNAGVEFATGLINGIKSALENFTIRVKVGGVDLGPLGSTPSVDVAVKPFSFLATGHPFIPYDNYPAMLHRGERVLTAAENREFSGGGDTYVTVVLDGEVIARAVEKRQSSNLQLAMRGAA